MHNLIIHQIPTDEKLAKKKNYITFSAEIISNKNEPITVKIETYKNVGAILGQSNSVISSHAHISLTTPQPMEMCLAVKKKAWN